MSDSLLKLTNTSINVEWDGQTHSVSKANLSQVALVRAKAKSLVDDPQGDQKLAAYCIYLILKDAVPGLTEDAVMQKASGALNTTQLMYDLGFLSPLEMGKIEEEKPTSESSSSPSPTEPAGDQKTSQS